METRDLGKTGLKVSPIGFGAWAIGGSWGPQDDTVSMAALHRYADLGGNFIDTALAYGDGHSERLIGRFLRERPDRDRFIIASKVPPLTGPDGLSTPMADCFPESHLRSCVDRSLSHLGRDAIDVIQLHTWAGNWNAETEWLDVIGRLKAEGKIRFHGVSVVSYREDEFIEPARSGSVDTIQTRFNLLDQASRSGLLDAAQSSGTGVIVRTPLGPGTLTGKMTRDLRLAEGDWRAGWLKGEKLDRLMEHLERLEFLTRTRSWPDAALQFVLAHPEVSSAIPGIRSPKQAEQNLAALSAEPLTAEDLEAVHTLYDTKFGGDETELWR